MVTIPVDVGPPLVVALLPVTLTLTAVLAFVLLLLKKGWVGYRGMIVGIAFTLLAFWALRALLFAGLNEVWRTFGSDSVAVLFWGGVALSLVAIFVLAVMIRRTAEPIGN